MSYKPIKRLSFDESKYPEVVKMANKVARFEDRKVHDAAKRLILEGGKSRIAEIEKERAQTQSASAG